jgi:RNA polymerase sigma-70 factor (ECF subfamily)
VDTSSSDSLAHLSIEQRQARVAADAEILLLFDQCAPQLLRYVSSFRLGAEATEDIVQDAFLALFRHVRLGRDRTNLTGWLFQVAHNLALKERTNVRRRLHDSWDESLVQRRVDPTPSPEDRLAQGERRQRLCAVVNALPERERHCLYLRAEGLTYRDIAATLRISLGAVAKSLARSMTRLLHVDRG